MMKLTLKRRLAICFEVLFARSGHAHTAQEKQLSTFIKGYKAGNFDKTIELSNDVARKYSELIYAVSTKHPGQSRHETALMYIKQCEEPSCNHAVEA
jgi:hypothetical protein